MDQSAITVRYAKALFSAAKDKGVIDSVKADIELVLDICNHSVDFILLLESPVIKTSKKAELITSMFDGETEKLTLKFLLLVTTNKREVYIPGICRNFLGLIRKNQNIKSAVLTTASEVKEETTEKIKNILGKQLNVTIELSTSINPDIIGGLILRLDDKQYDASISTRLKKIKQELLKSEL